MKADTSLLDDFEKNGRVWLRNAISDTDLQLFDAATMHQSKAGSRIDPNYTLSTVLAKNGSLRKAVEKLDPKARPVRVVAFNKSQSTNWGVPWHQDRVISVADKHETDGFKHWTKKAGVWHCEPPQELLDRMLFVRVHLDATDRANGAMQISVGSHARGVIPAADADKTVDQYPIESCDASRGDVLIMRMLTLHCSKPSEIQSDRRVIRIDFASFDLPAPLAWT